MAMDLAAQFAKRKNSKKRSFETIETSKKKVRYNTKDVSDYGQDLLDFFDRLDR